MLLTKKKLNLISESLRVTIPVDLEKEILAHYGKPATDDEGHIVEFTEQDIYEQLRKKLRPYMESAGPNLQRREGENGTSL
jgi:hypothetical protein